MENNVVTGLCKKGYDTFPIFRNVFVNEVLCVLTVLHGHIILLLVVETVPMIHYYDAFI